MKKTLILLLLLVWFVNSSHKIDVIIPMEENSDKQNSNQQLTQIVVKTKKPEMFKLIYFYKLVFVEFLLPFLDTCDTTTIFYLFHFLNVNRGYSLPPWHYEATDIKIINIMGIQHLYTFQNFQIFGKTISLNPMLYLPEENHQILFLETNIVSKILRFRQAYLFSNDKLCPVDREQFFHKNGILSKVITFKNGNEFVVTDQKNEILAKGEWYFNSDIAELAWEANNIGNIAKYFYKIIFYIQRFCLLYPRYLLFSHQIFVSFSDFVTKYGCGFGSCLILLPAFVLWYPNIITLPFHLLSLPWIIRIQNCWTGLLISSFHAIFYFVIFPWAVEMIFENRDAQTKYSEIAKMFEIRQEKNIVAIPVLAFKKGLNWIFKDPCTNVSLLMMMTICGSLIFCIISIVPMSICLTNLS